MRSRRRLLPRLFLWLSGLVVLGLGWTYRSWSHGGLPRRSGTVVMPALGAPVEIRFDGYGVPHVSAASTRDLAQAVGWLHANDRMFQLELLRRSGAGRLSEVVGAIALERDIEARTLRFRRSAEAMWEVLDPESRGLLEAYARGVNAWLEERDDDLPPGLRLLGIEPEPWTPTDSLLAHFLMARDLTYPRRYEERRFAWLVGLEEELALGLIGDRETRVDPELRALVAREREKVPTGEGSQRVRRPGDSPWTPRWLDAAGGSRGSNNWAVGASRSATGHPLVANDPHLPLAHPGPWYEATLRAPGYEAGGMTLIGLPLVIIGQSAELAWAFTNAELDVTDLFLEETSEDGKAVRRGEAWVPVRTTTETIVLRGGTNVELELAETEIGPLLRPWHFGYSYASSPGDETRLVEDGPVVPARSLAWTAYEPFDPLAVFLALARARTIDEVEAAAARFVCPVQNLVVGTRSGELLHTLLGRAPRRRHGDGRLPGLAWRAEEHWDGLLPHAAGPRSVRPPEDLLVTANAEMRRPGEAQELTGDFATPHRRDRIRERLLERSAWSLDELGTLQTERVSLYAREVCALLESTLGELDGELPAPASRAREALAGWDGTMATKGPAALFALFERRLGELMSVPLLTAGLEPLAYPERLPTILRFLRGELGLSDDPATPEVESRTTVVAKALGEAWEEAVERFGDDVRRFDYGALHRWVPYHPLGRVPLLGSFFRRGPFEVPGSGTTIGVFSGPWSAVGGDARIEVVHGASLRWVADTADPDRSRAVLPVGQSGHPFDPHYADQLELYLAGELRPAPWSQEAIDAATVSRLELRP